MARKRSSKAVEPAPAAPVVASPAMPGAEWADVGPMMAPASATATDKDVPNLLDGVTERWLDIGDSVHAKVIAGVDAGSAFVQAYQHTASADATAGADATPAPTTGKKIVIDDVIVSADSAMKVTFEEETSGTDVLVLYMAANSSAQVTPRGRLKLATANKKLRMLTSVSGNIAATVCYHSEN